jgi:hypothetical protein
MLFFLVGGWVVDWDSTLVPACTCIHFLTPKHPPHIYSRFLETVALHIAKNYLVDRGAFDASTRMPLVSATAWNVFHFIVIVSSTAWNCFDFHYRFKQCIQSSKPQCAVASTVAELTSGQY